MYLAHDPSKVKSYGYLSFKYIHERKLVTVVNISICPEKEQSHYVLHSKQNLFWQTKSYATLGIKKKNKKIYCHKNLTMIFTTEFKQWNHKKGDKK